MKKVGAILIAGLFLICALTRLPAQSEDPSDIFLKAYMTSQQAEKLEHENEFKAALAKYRAAGALIEQLHKNYADWQPAIVEYRGRKISESILRVQDKAGTQSDLAGTSAPPEENAPPPSTAVPQPSAVITTARPSAAPPQVANDSAIKEATKKLNDKIDQLQSELRKSRSQLETAQKEKESLNGRLNDTTTKLTQAHGELEKSKTAERQGRDQLARAEQSLKKIESSPGASTKAQEALRAEITRLKDALTAADEARLAAEKEKEQRGAKLAEAERKIVTVTQERDQAVAQLKGGKESEQRVQMLVAENSDLKKKLADAEKSMREISAGKPQKEQELVEVKGQLEQLRTQLLASQKQNHDYELKVADLRSQLDDMASQLEKAKLKGATNEETIRLTKENEMLRNIVVRERQEEARRDQAKKLLLAEFDKLRIKSDTLNEQIQLLAQPITKLSDQELALLRQPVVSISDQNPAAMKASFTFAKKSAMNAVNIAGSEGNAPPGAETQAGQPSGANANSGFNPDVPEEVKPVAREAKQNFEQRKYRAAEKQYQQILTKSPNNLYSLCNLGVVYFRTARFKAAELTLKKAAAVAPQDEFAHTTLGIVYYRQSKFDDALAELTKALAINPKSATAHNYLGITASQKGWQEAAEREILEAIADNPDYADAHFNLAVIYATQRPPAKELAKQHYAKATQLGTEPDASLEKLLH
ncbi:MAG TPA: tetratricopeptide repeat protein [Chthoniobacterales bacterium]|nr:tetratricopeptide repeat protein [Chthoniobacterales bacterium]